jgi:putative ATPase
VLTFNPLDQEALQKIIENALHDPERGLGSLGLQITEEASKFLVEAADGDARAALNGLELAAQIVASRKEGHPVIDGETVAEAIQRHSFRYDKDGEEHYNLISAFIKSMRGSDPDAAVYWLARMLEAGEDPLFIARRMIILASEDIGNADPHALLVAVAAKEAFHFVGLPEGFLPLAQAVIYLSSAPKSNAVLTAYGAAQREVKKLGSLPVPLHLRNAPTGLMKSLDYGREYKYPHDYEEGYVRQTYLPEPLAGRRFYYPSSHGREKMLQEWLERLKGK